MASKGPTIFDLLGLVVREGKKRIVLMTLILSVVALGGLWVGVTTPKRYDASTLLVVESGVQGRKILEGRLGSTEIELTPITLQITEGRTILRELLVFGGWVKPPPAKQPSPETEAGLIKMLRGKIKIDAAKEGGLIRISFNDGDPVRTFNMTNKLAEIYIRESAEAQGRESRQAFEFIDKQVKECGERLATYHQQVLTQFEGQDQQPEGADKKPKAGAMGNVEVAQLRREKAMLEAQLSRRSARGGGPSAAEESLKQKVTHLQGELGRLRATYTEQHPDVKQAKRELAEAQDQLRALEEARRTKESDTHTAGLDEEVRNAARARLDRVNKKLGLATGVPVSSPALINGEGSGKDELKGIGHDTTLSELLRRYEATRDVYQDLLKRREQARSTMELVAQHQGVRLRVQEPAEMPAAATGLRVTHICLVGLVLGLLIPIGILFGIVKLDGKVRNAAQIEALAKVPLLLSIHPAPAPKERSQQRRRMLVATAMVVGVCAIYTATFIIKIS